MIAIQVDYLPLDVLMEDFIQNRYVTTVLLMVLMTGCTNTRDMRTVKSSGVGQAANTAARSHDTNIGIGEPSPISMNQLIGMNEQDVRSRFGAPVSQENRAPTKQWVFRAHRCALNVTLYADVKTRQFHVLSYEVNSDGHSPNRNQHCVADFSSRLATKVVSN